MVQKRPVVSPPSVDSNAFYSAISDIPALVRKAQQLYPAADFAGVDFPINAKAPLTILMARGERWNTRATNYVYFDPYRGKYLGTWERGVNHTWGDAVIFYMGPIHFGVYWGMTVKVLWAVLGFSLSILAVTGVIIYWNRSFSKLWREWRADECVVSAQTL